MIIEYLSVLRLEWMIKVNVLIFLYRYFACVHIVHVQVCN